MKLIAGALLTAGLYAPSLQALTITCTGGKEPLTLTFSEITPSYFDNADVGKLKVGDASQGSTVAVLSHSRSTRCERVMTYKASLSGVGELVIHRVIYDACERVKNSATLTSYKKRSDDLYELVRQDLACSFASQ